MLRNRNTRAIILSLIIVMSMVAMGGIGIASANQAADADATELDIEIEHATGSAAGTGNGTHQASKPVLYTTGNVTLDSNVEFEIENTNTDESLSVTPADGEEIEWYVTDRRSMGLAFFIYRAGGELIDSPEIIIGEDRIDADVEGDETTFSQNPRDTYRVSMYQDGELVDSTSERGMSTEHEKDFEKEIGDDEIEVSFNAGQLTTDAELSGGVWTDEDHIRWDDVYYDDDAHRFVAIVDREEIPTGEHRAYIEVSDAETGIIDMYLSNRLVVEDGVDDPEGVSVTLEPSDETVVIDGETSVDVVVSGAENGISSYDIDIPVSGDALIDDFEQMQDPQFDASEIEEEGMLLDLEAGMGENAYEPAEEIVIATMTVEVGEPGVVDLEVAEAAVADVDVNQYEIGVTEGTSLEVLEEIAGPTEPIVGEDPPQDLTGDGLHEDVTGDGEVTIFDVQALFGNLEEDTVQDNPEAFNFAGDEDPEEVTIFDVQAFFGQLDELQDDTAE